MHELLHGKHGLQLILQAVLEQGQKHLLGDVIFKIQVVLLSIVARALELFFPS